MSEIGGVGDAADPAGRRDQLVCAGVIRNERGAEDAVCDYQVCSAASARAIRAVPPGAGPAAAQRDSGERPSGHYPPARPARKRSGLRMPAPAGRPQRRLPRNRIVPRVRGRRPAKDTPRSTKVQLPARESTALPSALSSPRSSADRRRRVPCRPVSAEPGRDLTSPAQSPIQHWTSCADALRNCRTSAADGHDSSLTTPISPPPAPDCVSCAGNQYDFGRPSVWLAT